MAEIDWNHPKIQEAMARGASPDELADIGLSLAGYDEKGRQKEQYAVEQAEKRAENIVRSDDVNIAIQMAEAGHVIRGMAKYVQGLSEEFNKMKPFINAAAKQSMDVAVQGAVERIEEQRKRRPKTLRPRWEQRPPHLLEEAIKKAVTIETLQGHDDTVVAAFDEDILDEQTAVGSKDGKGYWRSVEFGRRFIMPQGVWRGPDGKYVKAEKGRNDAYYISRGTAQRGRRGNIWAYDPKQAPLDWGKAKAETWVSEYLQQEASEIFYDFMSSMSEGRGGNVYDSGQLGGGGSVAGLTET